MDQNELPVVQTAGLTKIFKDFWRRDRVLAVDDLDLEVRPGEVFGLLGPNGSGKSTTIKMLLGLLYPTRGRVAIFGKPPTDVAVKARLGFLPEESYLYRFLNARETLDLYGRLFKLHTKLREERIDKLLDMVGLRSEAKRHIGEYSKGMARRIGMAQALINDPEFLILDEPTAGLDPIGIKQIKDVIRELAGRGKTILLSSHLLGDVEDVCDRVMILYGGREQTAGTIDELLRHDDRTQITTEKLSPETVEEIREIVLRREQKELLSVGAPSDRLETVFMRTVARAQKANVASTGARAGGEIPDFLGAPAKEDLIGSLVSAADTDRRTAALEPIEHRPEPEPPDAKHKKDLIDALTQAAPEAVTPSEDAPAPAETTEPDARKSPEADRGVIDSLLDHTKDSDGD
jgi:ABC-2 type transport system ATP-binding protein